MTTQVKFLNKLNLPSLPVPKLNQTLPKYLKSLEPFLNGQELENTQSIVKKFEDNEGPRLQNYLENRAQNCENWLSEWRDNIAYLDCRYSLPIFSSPGLVFPLQNFENQTEWLEYAAKLILGAIDHKFKIDKDRIPPDTMGGNILDMSQYKKIYGTCRIPRPKRDELKFNPDSRHIVVVRNNHFFRMEVITLDHEILSFNQILNQLMFIVKNSEMLGVPTGILSSDDRDNWCHAHEILKRDPTNRQTLDAIEETLFLLCLDNPLPKSDDDALTLAAHQCLHGGGSGCNSANRWFDKTVQFIVSSDGIVGLTYEHTPCEGQPIAVLSDNILNYMESKAWKSLPDMKTEKYPEPLHFNIDEELDKLLDVAGKHADKLANSLELNVFNFKEFGKDFVKSQKLSPDSFIQMAIQYAFYRIHKIPGAHYESASTKKYIHGRTEGIRSCSVESIAFIKTMLDKTPSDLKKINALRTAVNSHKNYVNDAINGFGVDRHLLGLKIAAEELNQTQPEIFTDVAFTRSSTFRLVTSQVAAKRNSVMAYKPKTPNGYSVCYNPRPEDIFFAISCFVDDPETDSALFGGALEKSLMDMHDLLTRNPHHIDGIPECK